MGAENNNKEKLNRSDLVIPTESEFAPAKKKKKKLIKAHIVTNPNICGGEPCIKGTRIPVDIILSHLASGDDDETIIENFPKMKKEDIEACRQFAERRAEWKRRRR